MKKNRLSAEQRREVILAAAAPLFARHGFNGVSTRSLAEAAGVSEALLYRHFGSKRELYAATENHLTPPAPDNLPTGEIPPSTRRLVVTLQHLLGSLDQPANELATRQLGHSLLDDGALAKTYFCHLNESLITSLSEDLRAARAAGEIEAGSPETVDPWLIHHLLLGMQMTSLPERSPLDYRAPRFALQQRCLIFMLRGLGLKPAAIDRYVRAD